MSFMTCCVTNCLTRSIPGKITFHGFPNPVTEQERFQAWIKNIGGEVATLEQTFVYKNRRVCYKHFEDVYRGSTNRLSKMAVPTLKLSGVMIQSPKKQEEPMAVCVPTPSPISSSSDTAMPIASTSRENVTYVTAHVTSKVIGNTQASQSQASQPSLHSQPGVMIQSPKKQEEPMAVCVPTPSPISSSSDTAMPIASTSRENVTYVTAHVTSKVIGNTQASRSQASQPSLHRQPDMMIQSPQIQEESTAVCVPTPRPSSSSFGTVASTSREHVTYVTANVTSKPIGNTQACCLPRQPVLTPQREVKLKNLIVSLKQQVRRNKIAKSSFKQRLIMARKTMKNDAMKHIGAKMSNATKTFIEMQVKSAGKKGKGRRFTLKEKILALSIYKPSPKAYRVLSEICILPQRKTLNNLLQKIPLQPGINDMLFLDMKRRVDKLPLHHRHCTLIFDEMSIAAGISYNHKQDEIVGFTDNGMEKKNEFCDHVLVFMVRGIIKKYKQPVAYSFCKSTTNAWDLVRQIKDVIKKLQEIGLEIIATVCDQGSTNMSALNILLNKTKEEYLKKGIEWKGGFFEIGSKKIVPIYDPPHLMKGVRNNLLNKNLRYVLKNKECTAKWQHIIDFYRRAPGYKGKRLVPKLTAHHVLPELIPKMRVKHCTQVFSHSVGVALGFMADAGKLPEGAQDTADLLLFFDNLFDSLNGSSTNNEGGKIYRCAVSPKSAHHKLWRECLPVLKSMKFIKDGDEKEITVPTLTSWVKTIEGIRSILKELYNRGLTSILLRNFNQDPLENFFGSIRTHGSQNIMPNAGAFTAAFKTLLINNMTSAHSVGANCERDDNSCLMQTLETFITSSSEYSHINNERNEEVIEEHLNIADVDVNEIISNKDPIYIERCAALGYCSGWLVSKARKIYKNCAECKSNLESPSVEEFHNFIKVCEYSDKSWLCYPTKAAFNFFVQTENITSVILKKYCMKKNILQYTTLICSINLDMSFIKCNLHRALIIDFLVKKSVMFNIFTWCKQINKILVGKEINCDNDDPMQKVAHSYYEKNKNKARRKK